MKSPLRKLAALALGVTFSLALFEVSLRITARIHVPSPARTIAGEGVSSDQAMNEDLRILCVGNSYTEGIGAAPGFSYPEQLEGMLKAAYPGKNIRVINVGRSNINTSLILERFENALDRHRPDVVALMVGEPNEWSSYGYGSYLRRVQPERAPPQVWSSFHDFLHGQFRVYRFFSQIGTGYLARLSAPTPLAQADPLRGFRWIALLEDEGIQPYTTLAAQDARDAYDSIEALLKAEPARTELYGVLGKLSILSLNDQEQATFWFAKALLEAGDSFPFDLYFTLDHTITHLGDREQMLWRVPFLKRASKNYPGDRVYSSALRWILANHLPEAKETKSHGARVALYMQLLSYSKFRLQKMGHIGLWLIKEGKVNEVLDAMIQAIERNPLSVSDPYPILQRIQEATPNAAIRKKVEDFMADYTRRFPAEKFRMVPRQFQAVRDWVKSDVLEMIAVLDRRRIPYLLQNYAPRNDELIRPADQALDEIARERRLQLVDNRAAFQQLFREAGNKSQYYTRLFGPGDNHLNEQGYEIMARVLFNALKERRLLERLDPALNPAQNHP